MRAVVLNVILVCFTGCSLLKSRSVNNADSSYVQREKLTSSVSFQERTDNEIRLVFSDSAKQTFMVEISPEGDFMYSPIRGYKGKAKVLKISGNGEVWKQVLGSASAQKEIKVDSASSRSLKSEVNASNSQTSVKPERPGKWYVWTLIVAGGLIGWVILKERLRA